MSKELVIFGTGGFAREVHQIVEDSNQDKSEWEFIGFLDGDTDSHGSEVHNFPVIGGLNWLSSRSSLSVIVAVGSPAIKNKITNHINTFKNIDFPNIIHPLAWIGNRVSLGIGNIICAGNLITTDIDIMNHTTINLDCTIGHDSLIGDFTTLAPSVNVSGNVLIGKGSELGTGSTVIQHINIGNWSVIGAGSVIIQDIKDNSTIVGNPGRQIKQREDGWHL